MLVSHDGIVFEAEGRLGVEVIEEEEVGVRVLGQPHLRRGDVREQRQRHAIVLPAERFAQHAQEGHRAHPAVRRPPTSPTCIDAEPSCRMTRSTPAVRMIDEVVWGRATAVMVRPSASSRHSQNSSSPRNGIRSRTGISRRRRSAATSPRRCHAWRSHSSSSTPGTTRSGRDTRGAPNLITNVLALSYAGAALAGLLGFLPLVGPHRDDHLELLGVGVHRHFADPAVNGVAAGPRRAAPSSGGGPRSPRAGASRTRS